MIGAMRKSTYSGEYASLRKRLVSTRASAGLTQRQLAKILNVPHSWIAKVESGERRIDLVEFAWFCNACGVSPATEAAQLLREWKQPNGAGGYAETPLSKDQIKRLRKAFRMPAVQSMASRKTSINKTFGERDYPGGPSCRRRDR